MAGQDLKQAIFCTYPVDAALLATLAGQAGGKDTWLFCPPGELPNLPTNLSAQFHVVQTVEPLNQWVVRLPGMAWIVPSGSLAGLSSYERNLLTEDALRYNSLILEWKVENHLPNGAELMEQAGQACSAWESGTVGCHPQGRQLQLRNLTAGVTLRARLARQHAKHRGRDVHSLVFVNSRLFGGSEVYGFLTAWTLRRIGFSVQTCMPDFDHYGAGGAKMGEWLAEHDMPTPANVRYGDAGRLFFDPEFVSDGVIQRSRPLANWMHQRNADLVFCSGFIPEPILAAGKRLPVFAAFFPPWGYALNRMTFLRHYLDGLASDCNWALQLWGRWLPEPRACIPSLIEASRFTILNQALPAEPVQIALVGTMMHMKGHRQALLAVEQLAAEGFNLHLNVYGFELEMYADFIREMKKLAEGPHLKGQVTFHGFVDDALEINRHNHLILSASLAEGLPQALAFHQAAGLLPVAAPAGGIPEIVVDGQTGFLANGFEVPDLVQALRRALQNRADWPRLIENGRQLLVETASEPVFASRLLAWMERGLEIRFSEGRNYFSPQQVSRAVPSVEETVVESRQLPYRSPTSAPILDESRMLCSPALGSAPLVYSFECPTDQLGSLRLRLATFLSHPQGELFLELYPPGGNHLLRRVTVPASAVLDNAWMEVSFQPLQNMLGQVLEVRISARLQKGRLAVYESSGSPAHPTFQENALRLGRRFLPIPGRRFNQAVFKGEDE